MRPRGRSLVVALEASFLQLTFLLIRIIYVKNRRNIVMMQSQTYDIKRVRPTRWQIFLHECKTFRLLSALITDRRISLWRKMLFFGTIGGLPLLLLFPDLFNEAFLSTV